jgi:hypothetical protein
LLFVQGLKPFYLSKKEENPKFTHIPEPVQFREDSEGEFYTLSFIYDFKHDIDEVEFASQPPYGF